VSGLASPSTIQIDSANVYWSDATNHAISAVPIAGGSVVPVAAPQSTAVVDLALDDAYVYYWQGASILRARKDGTSSTTPELVVTAAAQGTGLGVDTANGVYFVSSTEIETVPKTGGAIVPFATLLDDNGQPTAPLAVASDNAQMFVVVRGFGVNPTDVRGYPYGATSSGPTREAFGAFQTWLDADPVGLACYGNLNVVQGPGGVTSGFYTAVLAATGCGVAWADSAGLHWNMFGPITLSPLDSPVDSVLIAPGVGPVESVTSDGRYIYWTDNGTGAIGKLPVP
jgi:hypothetical protein